MKKLGLVIAALVGIVAGCAVSQQGSGRASGEMNPAATNHLVAEPASTSMPAKGESPANVLAADIFHYASRVPAKPSALTAGWTELPLRFQVQHPYNLKLAERWRYDPRTDTQDLWVFGTDKAHMPPPNRTTARTELRLIDPDYKVDTGLHMMSCQMYIVPGTFAAITQVFATGPMAMIVVNPDGTIFDLRTHQVIAKGMNGKWFAWNVVHDSDVTGKGAIKIYVNGTLADGDMEARKSESYYFKVGVYSRHGSDRSEVKIRDLRLWQKGTATR